MMVNLKDVERVYILHLLYERWEEYKTIGTEAGYMVPPDTDQRMYDVRSMIESIITKLEKK